MIIKSHNVKSALRDHIEREQQRTKKGNKQKPNASSGLRRPEKTRNELFSRKEILTEKEPLGEHWTMLGEQSVAGHMGGDSFKKKGVVNYTDYSKEHKEKTDGGML